MPLADLGTHLKIHTIDTLSNLEAINSGLTALNGRIYVSNDSLDIFVGNTDGSLKKLEGEKGDDGLSAYQIWLDDGNSGTEQDFLDSLIGPPGEDGADGTDCWGCCPKNGIVTATTGASSNPATFGTIDVNLGSEYCSSYSLQLTLRDTGSSTTLAAGEPATIHIVNQTLTGFRVRVRDVNGASLNGVTVTFHWLITPVAS